MRLRVHEPQPWLRPNAKRRPRAHLEPDCLARSRGRHSGFQGRLQSDVPFHSSENLREWAPQAIPWPVQRGWHPPDTHQVTIRSFPSPVFNSGGCGRKPSGQYIAGVDVLTHFGGLKVLYSVIGEAVSETCVRLFGPMFVRMVVTGVGRKRREKEGGAGIGRTPTRGSSDSKGKPKADIH